MHLEGNSAPIGFYAIATAVESIRKLGGYHYHGFGEGRWFPCLHLVNVAVGRKFQNRGLGKILVGTAITLFAEVGPLIGLPHMILTPISDNVIPFYQSLGFTPYDDGARMFLPLKTAVEVVEQERARQEAIDAGVLAAEDSEKADVEVESTLIGLDADPSSSVIAIPPESVA